MVNSTIFYRKNTANDIMKESTILYIKSENLFRKIHFHLFLI